MLESDFKHLFSLNDKIAVVTGGTGILGSFLCRRLANAGAITVIVVRSEDDCARLANEIEANEG